MPAGGEAAERGGKGTGAVLRARDDNGVAAWDQKQDVAPALNNVEAVASALRALGRGAAIAAGTAVVDVGEFTSRKAQSGGSRGELIKRGLDANKAEIALQSDGSTFVSISLAGILFRGRAPRVPKDTTPTMLQEGAAASALRWLERSGRGALRGFRSATPLPSPQLRLWRFPPNAFLPGPTASIVTVLWDENAVVCWPGGERKACAAEEAIRLWLSSVGAVALDAEFRYDATAKKHLGAALLQLAPLDGSTPPLLVQVSTWRKDGAGPTKPFPHDLAMAIAGRQTVVWGAGRPANQGSDWQQVSLTLGLEVDVLERYWVEAQALFKERYPATAQGGTSIGLAAAARAVLGVDPPKTKDLRLRNWTKPLDAEAAEYAALDAVLVGRILGAMLADNASLTAPWESTPWPRQ